MRHMQPGEGQSWGAPHRVHGMATSGAMGWADLDGGLMPDPPTRSQLQRQGRDMARAAMRICGKRTCAGPTWAHLLSQKLGRVW